MATLSIKESREFVVFKAFSSNDSCEGALKDLEKYDRENPDKCIFTSAEDKKGMRDSYVMFKEAERMIDRVNGRPDYDNPQIMERMKTILSQKLPAISRDVIKDATTSVAINKANIGRMLFKHAKNVGALSKRMMKESVEHRHEQPRVSRHGNVGRSPYEKVYSDKKTYQRNEDVLIERMLREDRA